MLQTQQPGPQDEIQTSQAKSSNTGHYFPEVMHPPRKETLDCESNNELVYVKSKKRPLSRKEKKENKKKRRATYAKDSQVGRSGIGSENDDRDQITAGSRSGGRFESHIADCNGLISPSVGTHARLVESSVESAARLERLKEAVRTLLECVGEDPDREGLLRTPERYAKALLYFTKGYEQDIQEIVNGAIFHEDHSEMVVVKDIEIFSLCEHHLVPFTGVMHIGYIPDKSVIGLSKLVRVAEMFGRRLQVQERLTSSVAHALFSVLQPQGVAVVMESKHLCMGMRGVQNTSSTTVTSCMTGCFEGRSRFRDEFFQLISSKG